MKLSQRVPSHFRGKCATHRGPQTHGVHWQARRDERGARSDALVERDSGGCGRWREQQELSDRRGTRRRPSTAELGGNLLRCGDGPSDAHGPAAADGIPDNVDLCPFVVDESGNNTADSDRDGIGNACDLCAGPLSEYQVDGALLPDYMQVRLFPLAGDIDGDGVGDACDNCPSVANCFNFGAGETFTGAVPIIDGVDCQADSDADGIGDACDPDLGGDASSGFGDQDDFDGDGLPNALDACPRAALDEAFRTPCEGPEDCPEDRECSPSGQCNHRDTDRDGIGDVCDTCIAAPNPAQALAGDAVDDDPDSDGVGQLCELGAGMGCGDISNAAGVAYHPVSVGGSCCTVELLVGDDGQLLRAEGCQTSDLGSCVGLEAPHPEQPGVFIPVRASNACSQAQRNAFECVVLPAGFEVVPGLLNPPPGCDGALGDAGLSLEQNLQQGAVEGENPWLRACRRPQLDGDFDSIGDACDACPSAWDPGGAPYVDSDGMQWPDAGAVCNGDYGECI